MNQQEERELFNAMREVLLDGLSEESEESEWSQFLQRLRAEADPQLQAVVARIDSVFAEEPEVIAIELAPDSVGASAVLKL